MKRLLILFCLFATQSYAEPPDRHCTTSKWGEVHCIRDHHFAYDLCNLIAASSRIHGLDPNFFARLLWQESRFNPNALSHAGAQGIAQFMPGTAKLRGLQSPYNPARAVNHSAHYLAELNGRFGNLGMAAVAYNGGETRATRYIAKTGGLAQETINYVKIITGLSAKTWRDAPRQSPDLQLDPNLSFLKACYALAKNRALSRLQVKSTPPNHSPWGVQLASGSTKAKALRSYNARIRVCKSAIKSAQPEFIYQKAQVAARKPYIAARLGAPTRSAANALCRKLRQARCVCAVYKN